MTLGKAVSVARKAPGKVAPRKRVPAVKSRSARADPPKAHEPYHHGDLRAALLRAAGELLAERGVEGFTLREAARRAGVSHGAPAHHFGDVAGMLTAYAAEGYMGLNGLMHEYQSRASGEGWTSLQAAGLAYVDFAVANRALFQLMFRSDRLSSADPAFKACSEAAYQTLAEAMRAAAPALDEAQLGERILLAWSTVHGFATLVLEGQLAHHYGTRSPGEFARAMGERLVSLLRPALSGNVAAKGAGA